MQQLPDWFWAERLTPINYYRYRSSVRDRFVEIDAHDIEQREECSGILTRFNELKSKCMHMEVNIAGKDELAVWRPDVWDNKIAIECLTEAGNTIFVGFYDGVYTIGLSVEGDVWIKPWPYRQAIKEGA